MDQAASLIERVDISTQPAPVSTISSTGHHTHAQSTASPKEPGNIKMVALDMDGTLLNPDDHITPRVHKTIHEAVKRGIHIVLATARPPRHVRFYHRALKLHTPIVSHNGALIWDERQKSVIRHISLPHALARRVVDYARLHCPDVIPSIEIVDKLYSDHFGAVPLEALPAGCTFNPDVVAALESFLHVPVTRVMFHAKSSVIEELVYLLAKRFDNRICLFRSDSRLLQVVAPDTNKALALDFLCQSYGITAANVLAVGDNANDLPMLKWAGISAAMANAPEQVRKAAQYMVPSNQDDGVAEAIERFALT